MARFLITAANSDISISIARILRSSFLQCQLVGVAPDGKWPGSHFFDHLYNIPLVSEVKEYKSVLESVIKHHNIDVLCPVSEKELLFFSENHYNPIEKIVMNPKNILENFLDKYKTYTFLDSLNIPVPETFLMSDVRAKSLGKCIIKPRSSAGSKSMYSVDNNVLFDALVYTYKDSLDNFVVQHEVGTNDEEYTCALWRFDGSFRNIILKRKLQGGLTCEAQVVDNNAIESVLNKIATHIEGNFFINVQLRLENDRPYIFEINPRFSSTVMMRHKVGFQDVLWSFLSMIQMRVPSYSLSALNTKLFRIADEIVIPNERL